MARYERSESDERLEEIGVMRVATTVVSRAAKKTPIQRDPIMRILRLVGGSSMRAMFRSESSEFGVFEES